jgi:hypothetical protein
MSAADKAIKRSTIVAVLIVAAVAASFSYLHALEVVGQHSRPSIMNNAFPLTVDGLIYAGSMVLLNDARRGLDAHPLAWFALGLGISATLTVNVVSGLAFGVVGAIVSAWPAVALILSYELLMIIVRRSASTAPVVETAAPEPPAELNGHAAEAVELFADDLAAGSVPSVRRVRREMHLGQPRAQQVHSYLTEVARS